MAQAFRIDTIAVGSFTKTPEGFLIIPARIARVGVQEYRRADGTVQREYRPPEEVGSPDSLASFRLRPVTLEHPPELVNSSNVSRYAVGHLGEDIKFDGQFVTANVAVVQEDAVRRIESGEIRELSCGYQVAWDPSPGRTDDGLEYDGSQRRIVGNHVALTKKGRAGPEVRLLLDSADDDLDVAVCVERLDEGCGCDRCQSGKSCGCSDGPDDDEDHPPKRRKRRMSARITIDGAEFEVSEAVAAAYAASRRADAAERAALSDELDELRADARKKAAAEPPEDDEWEGDDMADEDMDDEDMEYDDEDEDEEARPRRGDSIAEFQGRIDALYEYIEALEQELAAAQTSRVDSADFDNAVDSRLELLRRAEPILGADYDHRGRSDREVMEDALAVFDSADLSDRSDDYVAARFDALIELRDRRDSGGVAELERAIAGASTPATGADYSSAYIQSLTEAWKAPLIATKER